MIMKRMWVGLALLMPCFGVEWEQVEIEGARYVTLSQVAQFYRFEKPKAINDEVTLRNRDITAIFEVDSRKASFNKVGFLLERKLLRKDESFYLSEGDLLQLVEPVLRPFKVKGLAGFQTVIFALDLPQGLPGRELLMTELRSELRVKGFKVITFGDEKKGEPDWSQFQNQSKKDRAVVIHLSIRDGKRMALKSEALGVSPGAGLALATGIHWKLLQRLKENPGLANFNDDRVSVGQPKKPNGTDWPACRLEMTYDFSRESTAEKFHRTIAKSVGEAISFARKAGQTNEAAGRGEEPN